MEVLLGLLTISPMSGYDLGQTIRESVGRFWNESYGQIYPNLKKMAGDGLVTSKTERQKGKPDRHIYSITKKGREHLVKWLAVDPQPEIPRNELLLKLFFGAQTTPQVLIGYLERMVVSESAVLKELSRLEHEIAQNQRYPDAPYWKMAAHFGRFELEAHVHWAEETVAELNKIARKQQSGSGSPQEKKHAGTQRTRGSKSAGF
jgi:DNA-binding PadR family transcriptional regulator